MQSGRTGGMSRRGFLIAGGAAAVIAAAGGVLAVKLSRPESEYREIAGPGPDPLVLGSRLERSRSHDPDCRSCCCTGAGNAEYF